MIALLSDCGFEQSDDAGEARRVLATFTFAFTFTLAVSVLILAIGITF